MQGLFKGMPSVAAKDAIGSTSFSESFNFAEAWKALEDAVAATVPTETAAPHICPEGVCNCDYEPADIKIVADSAIPPGEVHAKNARDEVVGKITNIETTKRLEPLPGRADWDIAPTFSARLGTTAR